VSIRLADLTTLRVGGAVKQRVTPGSETDFIDAIREADATHTPLLVVGGGSNILASDDEFDGVVIQDQRQDIHVETESACGGVEFTVSAGTPWEDVVEAAVANSWSGFEALTGIPGSTGATPVQNVGAYGQEVRTLISQVRCWDRKTSQIRTFSVSELEFGYRDSLLKRSIGDMGYTPRYVVLSVRFHTRLADLSAPVQYAELAASLDVDLGQRVPARDVRQAVLGLRRGKGMVLDQHDHDTWSAGSFFTNPIIDHNLLPSGAPQFPADQGPPEVKTSAAWLISQSGIPRGFSLGTSAALSTKHVLALTNRGGASAHDLVTLARYVRDHVHTRYGIWLVPEPVLVGVSL